MSKVICDVCGTTYPETDSMCPICGSAKATAVQTTARSAMREDADNAGYAKGGHFSKRNVKKRNKAKEAESRTVKPERPARTERLERRERDERPARREKPEKNRTNIGLVIVIILLLIGIVAVTFYIAAGYFLPGFKDNNKKDPVQTTPPVSTTEPEVQIPCRTIKLSSETIELSFATQAWLLSTEVGPADTTDEVTFTSSDENVITVEPNGKDCLITAVGGGEATITVKCGDVEATCTVICSFEPLQPSTEPTETTEPQPTVPEGFVLKLKYSDISLQNEEDIQSLFTSVDGVTAADIKWTSDKPDVVRVDENGKVYGVSKGNATITAEIAGQTATCIVRCKFNKVETNGNYISCLGRPVEDVTMKVGETLTISLYNAEGVNLGVTWTVSKEGYVTINGNRITADTVTVGTNVNFVTISCEYEGVTYTCKIRIKEA